MARVLAGLAAWLGGTAAAVCLAWFGAGMVIRNTTASPAVPVISAAPPAAAAAPVVPTVPASAAPSVAVHPSGTPSSAAPPRRPSPSPSSALSLSPSGQPRSYTLDGGQVTLLLTADSAQLVTAVPQAGFAVQTWSGPDWLRVDFSSGPDVSSLIASWNGHPPSVTVTNG